MGQHVLNVIQEHSVRNVKMERNFKDQFVWIANRSLFVIDVKILKSVKFVCRNISLSEIIAQTLSHKCAQKTVN